MTTRELWADALVVVDVQRTLVSGEHAVPDADTYLHRWTDVLASARAAGVPVVHLQDDGAHDPHVRLGSPGWELALPVVDSDLVVAKASDDAFVETDLEELLRDRGVTRICLIGIQSEMCVLATARSAMARGFTVVLPRDGHTTYDVPADGRAPAVPAALVSRVAEWSLGDEVVAPDRLVEVRFGRSPHARTDRRAMPLEP